VTISDDKNSYDSLSEMKQYVGSQVKDFNIRGENPKVHFLLNKAEQVPSSTPGLMITHSAGPADQHAALAESSHKA
jgi:hypothetical protein